MKKVKFMQLPSGVVLSSDEVRDLRVILTKLAVYSDNAVSLKRELLHAVRQGRLL